MYALLLTVLQSNPNHQAYALPGTNHAIINEPSKDIAQQRAYIGTIIHNMTNQQSQANKRNIHVNNPDKDIDHKTLRNTPHCFVTDTDSHTYLVDSGANRFIVNDAKMLKQFTATRASVKGISGTSVAIQGTGQHRLTIKSDNDHQTNIHVEAVFVPLSPYNIIPPQLLIHALKTNGYEIGMAAHDDKVYTFTYAKYNTKSHRLTVTANENDLFMLRTVEGYTKFSRYASNVEGNSVHLSVQSTLYPTTLTQII